MERKEYIPLKDLHVYQLARQLSKRAWEIYLSLKYDEKKNIGDQFIRSVDSVGANIAEGYHRYHFLDKARFYYNSRASMAEAIEHWAELLAEREIIAQEALQDLQVLKNELHLKLNNFINATKSENTK
jgi:four helix bundle protein